MRTIKMLARDLLLLAITLGLYRASHQLNAASLFYIPLAVAAGTLCLQRTDPVPDPSCHRSGLAQAKGMTVRRNSPPVAATPHLITGRPRTRADDPSVFASTALALNSVLTASTAVPPP